MLSLLFLTIQLEAARVHALAFKTTPKYAKDFKHFDWVNPNAPKGGDLRIATPVSYNSFNPFLIKGTPIAYLYTIETLLESSPDEPFTMYGLLAKEMEIAKDELGITFYLNENAKFSDETPVTADDVVFTFNLLTTDKNVTPFYRNYFSDVATVKAIDRRTVRFTFKKRNSELPLILGQLPIIPKHFYSKGDFATDFLEKILGSGPYTVESFDSGKQVSFKRNPKYWGNSLNVNIGKYNYDRIIFKTFSDDAISYEGLKAYEFDITVQNVARRWAVDSNGEKWKNNWLINEVFPNKRTHGAQMLAMNGRREIFKDINLRKALAYAMDFEWLNKTLFYNSYSPQVGYFVGGTLSAYKAGLPSDLELKVLTPLKDKIPPEVFTTEVKPIGEGLTTRKRLITAQQILKDTGYQLKKGVLYKGDKAISLVITLDNQSMVRTIEPYINNLKKLGIQAKMEVVDHTIYEQRVAKFDYDIIVETALQSETPGNEQVDMLGSSSLNTESSRNYMGISNPAVDEIISKILVAPDRENLVAAVRALDRVLWFNYYSIPEWYSGETRLTKWYPLEASKPPSYLHPYLNYLFYGWINQEKLETLKQAMQKNTAIKL